MNGQPGVSVTIEGLRIRVHTGTISPGQGQQLGEHVQRLLADRLAAWNGHQDRDIGAITIALQAPEYVSVEQLASRIADAILRQI